MTEMMRRDFAFRAEVGDGLVKGYASLFNDRLDDNAHREIFAQGCWAKSIRALFDEPTSRGEPSRIAVNWQHDWSTPFAVPTVICEDDKGLYTEAQVKLYGAGEVNADRWAQVKAGLVTGLSVEIDPSRSAFEYLGEEEARALGYTGEWDRYSPPRRWTEVYLLGWAYVLVPSMAGARVTEVRDAKGRATKGVRAMDETMKAEMAALIKAACDPIYERMDKIEKMMAGPAEGEEVEGKVEVTVGESEEMRTLKVQVAELRAANAEATFQAWRASHAPALDAEVARHIYAAPEGVRAAMLKMATPNGTTPALPPIGGGSGMREAEALPKTAKEAWEAIKRKHGTNRDAANAEWAQVREQYRN